MNALFATVLALTSTVFLSACSSTVAQPAAPTIEAGMISTDKGGGREQAVTISATVEQVDAKARKVTLKGYDGTSETVTVGDEVRNLDQVKKGDAVVVTYYHSVAFEVLKPGEKRPVATAGEGIARAEKGDRPGGVAASVVTVVAEVVKLDRKAETAVLKGPEGNLRTVKVENPANFDKVKVGDMVEITLTDAVAVDVQPAPKN